MADSSTATSGAVTFTGSRSDLFGLLFRGYLLMLPTIGLYRFWVTTWKRRFYWMNTVIDGDPLEYTGQPIQLLVGFLLALTVFLPIYIGLFFLSTQPSEVAGLGYAIVAAVFWFLIGYATYRGRDFRLSRTLWRGVRFDQKGSALRYAIRRTLWSILVLVTLGLAYPFLASSLWRYRYNNTWFGDRRFAFTGSWRTIAGPYYGAWFLVVLLLVGVIAIGAGIAADGGEDALSGWLVTCTVVGLPLLAFIYAWYRAREASKMFSCVAIGDARAMVRVRTGRMFLQFVLYVLALGAVLLLLAGFGGIIVAGLVGSGANDGNLLDMAQALQRGWIGILAVIAGYLAILSAFGLMGEVFLGYGYWMLIARGASILNVESLRSVKAADEDRALVGEGLADAFNVGGY